MKKVAYVLGTLLIARGLILTVNPQMWRTAWERYSRPYLPESMNRMAAEYARLSDQSLNVLGMWLAVIGVFLVALAGRVRE